MSLSLTLLATLSLSAASQASAANTPTEYLVGYSHLDTEWCWTYRHSILDCIPKTLHENFDLFEKYPNYVFNWTGAKRYRFMKEYYPDDYAKLKKYVASGQWVVTGSGWDECDASIPSPESVIRQVLYSNQFFNQEFGKTSNNYLIPDVFGFPASLPTILAHCGLKGMSTCKLTYGAGAAVPIPFNVGNWVGPDGTSIVAALNCQSYHTQVTEDLSNSKTLLERIADTKKKSGLAIDFTYYGLGDEGGSPGEGSVKWVQMSKHSTGPIKVVAGAADEMFAKLTAGEKAALPSYQGELLLTQHSAGTTTSGATMKRWNHDNELLADAAERASIAASVLTGSNYAKQRMTDAWTRILGGQMHDILPGTSIPQAYQFAWNDEIVALNESADVVREGIGNIVREMDTKAKGVSVTVYNPLSIEREDVVEATVPFKSASVSVVGPDGKAVPAQRSGNKVLFLAKVPSVGIVSFDVRPSSVTQTTPLKVSTQGLENERYRVSINAAGDVTSIRDKQADRELLSAPIRLAFMHQKPQRHPAWNMDWTDQQKPPVGYVDGPAKISIVEQGPVRVAVQVERHAQGSDFVQTVRLAAGDAGNRVEFSNTIDWRSSECSLKAVFPLTVSNPKATYNWEVGTVQRGNDTEKLYEGPSHQWFDLTNPSGDYGASVLTVAKYGSDKPDDSTLRLTLLYTPGVRDNYQHQATGDWGRHEILYALTGHKGDWRTGGTQDEAARLNQPLRVFATPSHEGHFGKTLSFAKLDRSQVRITAMKAAEESTETIVRVVEMEGKPANGVHLTFARPVLKVREVDGQEHPVSSTDLKIEGNTVTFNMSAYHPRAFAVEFPIAPLKTIRQFIVDLPLNQSVASSGHGQHDGDFDGAGRTIPGDLLEDTITSGGVAFGMSSKALVCKGQTVKLPNAFAGDRLYLLTASADGDRDAAFRFGSTTEKLRIQAWNGFIGEWDTRNWNGAIEDEVTYGWKHPLVGITPGFVKTAPVAWYADHLRLASGKDDPYHFCYLYRNSLNVPMGAKTVKLPNDPKIVILAATMTKSPSDEVTPLAPLYDTLVGHPGFTVVPTRSVALP